MGEVIQMPKPEGPGAAYKGVTRYKDIKLYTDDFSAAVRDITKYSEREKNKLTNGGVNAEKLWAHINILAAKYLGVQKLDPNDQRYKAVYAQVSNAVKRFGTAGITSDLLESVIGQYIQSANSYVAEKNRQDFGALPTEEGKKQLRLYAKAGGVDIEFEKLIDGAKDPTEVEQTAAQIDDAVRQKVGTTLATNTFPKLEEILKAA